MNTVEKLEKQKNKMLEAINRKIEKTQARQQKLLAAEVERRRAEAARLLAEAESLAKGEIKLDAKGHNRERILPRGVLTLGMHDVMKSHKKGMTVEEVVEKLLGREQFKSLNKEDLVGAARNSLNSNKKHFISGDVRGTYKVTESKLEGSLFERLRAEQKELVAA